MPKIPTNLKKDANKESLRSINLRIKWKKIQFPKPSIIIAPKIFTLFYYLHSRTGSIAKGTGSLQTHLSVTKFVYTSQWLYTWLRRPRLRLHVYAHIPSARVHNARRPCWRIYIRGTKGRNVFTQLSPHRRAEFFPHSSRSPSPTHSSLCSRAVRFSRLFHPPPFGQLNVHHGRRRICMECIHMKSTILPATSWEGPCIPCYRRVYTRLRGTRARARYIPTRALERCT